MMASRLLLCLLLLSAFWDKFVVSGSVKSKGGLERHLQNPNDNVIGKEKGGVTKAPLVVPATPTVAPTKIPTFFLITTTPSRAPTSTQASTSAPSKLPFVPPPSPGQHELTKMPTPGPISDPQTIKPTRGPTAKTDRMQPSSGPTVERRTMEPSSDPTSERYAIALDPFFLRVTSSELLDAQSILNATQTYFQVNMIFPNMESVLLQKDIHRRRRNLVVYKDTFKFQGHAIFSGNPPERDVVIGDQAELLQNSMLLQASLRNDPNVPDTIVLAGAGILAHGDGGEKEQATSPSSTSGSHSNRTAALVGVSACLVVIVATVLLFYTRLRRVRWLKSVSDPIPSTRVDPENDAGQALPSAESVPINIQEIEILTKPLAE